MKLKYKIQFYAILVICLALAFMLYTIIVTERPQRVTEAFEKKQRVEIPFKKIRDSVTNEIKQNAP